MGRALPVTSDVEPSPAPAVEDDSRAGNDFHFEGDEARHARALQRRLHDAFAPEFDCRPEGLKLRTRAVTIIGVSCMLWATIGFAALAVF